MIHGDGILTLELKVTYDNVGFVLFYELGYRLDEFR